MTDHPAPRTYHAECHYCDAKEPFDFEETQKSWDRMYAMGWKAENDPDDEHGWWWCCPNEHGAG